MDDDVFRKYYKRVAKRAWIKSVFVGLVASFIAMLVTVLAVFFAGADKYYYIAIIVFAVCAAASMPLLYYLRYKPTEKDVANAVDALGMEERFVTMLELDGSKSYIARRQREDTYVAAASTPSTAIRIAVSTVLIVLLSVFGVLGVGAVTYAALADAGFVPTMSEISDAVASGGDAVYYWVEYEEYDWQEDIEPSLIGLDLSQWTLGDGDINGARVQSVKEGEDATTVYAEALDDSMFWCWSDGNTSPERTDTKIMEEMHIYAIFIDVSDLEGEEGDGEGDGDGDGGEGEGDASGMGEEAAESDDGDGDGEGEGTSDSGQSDSTDGNNQNSGAGSGNGNYNYVNDGQTDHTTELENALGEAESDFNDGSYSDFESELGSDYMGRL